MHKFEYWSKLDETPKAFRKIMQNLEKCRALYNSWASPQQQRRGLVIARMRFFSLGSLNVLVCFVPAWSFSLFSLTKAWNYYLLVINLLRFHCCGLTCRFWLTSLALPHIPMRLTSKHLKGKVADCLHFDVYL